MKRLLVALGIVVVMSIGGSVGGMAALPHANPLVYRGGGWTLTFTAYQSTYGQMLRGSIAHAGHTYRLDGDVVPGQDEPRYLLRFYGPAFPGTAFKTVGLISVATFYPSCPPTCPQHCIPNCPAPAYSWYLLKALPTWKLPGAPKAQHVRLKR